MNFINLPYEIKNRDNLINKDLKKLLLLRESPRISGSNRLRSYYYITESPQTEDAIEFGFPEHRNWYLQITYSGFMKVYYTQSDFTSIMHVLMFNFCGLAVKNLNELIKQSEEQKLCYARKLQQSDDNTSEDTSESDSEDINERSGQNVNEDLNKMEIDESSDCLLPVIVVDDNTRWNYILNNELSLCEFCRYVEYVLGKGVVRLLRISIQLAYDKARIYLYCHKYIQQDLDLLMLSLCPSLHDILIYMSFCNYLTKTSSNEEIVSSNNLHSNMENSDS